MFSILIFAYRPLALVSTFVVADVIVKGLRVVTASESDGKSFMATVIRLLPVNTLKLGRKCLPVVVKCE